MARYESLVLISISMVVLPSSGVKYRGRWKKKATNLKTIRARQKRYFRKM
jgi:hypothetical protein